ncbi:MAG: SGNH/GDSL hydrolase family protein [Phormidium tanganyikae FI6-MK23]|jgi:lysophospholipase L1-like esterase|nr:SGNH/GDSL hydrolase family protein [Phormidium tanganyikae FI6-MK23]
MKRYLKLSVLIGFALLVGSPYVLPAASSPKVDKLTSVDWWRSKVKSQITASAGKRYSGCVFGDSISSGLGNTLGQSNFNFAVGGMSSVSLLEQLKQLKAGNVQCQKAVIAIGTNDAMFSIGDTTFKNNLRQIVTLSRGLGASEITLIPAFYSTVEASHNPEVAGTLDRVDEISTLIRQVAAEQDVKLLNNELQPLFRDRSLKEELTFDGVHLNDSGKGIYRQVLLGIFNNSAVSSR